MDRQIVYPGAIPLETDLLNTNRNTMVALAKLARALFGTNTIVNGLAVTATSPASMQVNAAPGEIYMLANLDATAYSSLAADTAHQIMKQGIALDAQALTLTAPATAGYSVNYLIQATYQDVDANAVALPYYNSANPAQAWSGPNNSGSQQYTTRSGAVVVSAKAGIAATTGSQATPAPDSGYVGLYVVTVANGQASITSANISQYSGAPILPAGLVQSIQTNGLTYAPDTGTANAYKANYSPAVTSLTDGMMLEFEAKTANSGASTFSPNGLTARPIVGGAHQALQGGEIIVGGKVEVMWHATLNSWVLLGCTGGASQVPTATQSQHAVPLSQVQSLISAVPSAPTIQGSAKNLRLAALGLSNYNAVLTADELALKNASGASVLHSGVSLTCNLNGTVGAINSLDTGALAANTWYGVFDIYNQTTQTFASLASAFTPTPTTGSTAGGALGATTYFVRVAYVNANGISLPSWSVTQAVSANNLLTVTSPAALAGATGYNVYVGTTFGNEQLQNASPIAIGTNWTEPTGGLVSGGLPVNPWPTVMPSGYSYRALAGAVRTDSSGSKYLLQTLKQGRLNQYVPLAGSNVVAMPIMASGTVGSPATPTWSAVGITTFAPPIAIAADVGLQSSPATAQSIAAPNPNYGAYSSTTNPPPLYCSSASSWGAMLNKRMVLEAPAIYFGSNAAAGNNPLYCAGWEDAA